MAVLRELAGDITKAVGINHLDVEPMARSASNMTMLLRGGGQVFFAKIYTDADLNALDANLRYDREKEILSQRWPVPTPTMVYSADVERVIVTREVPGHGFKHFMDEGRTLEALGMMARWIAGFHASADPQPRDETLWDHFSQYEELEGNAAFADLRGLLQSVPLTEYVLTKGDCTAHNFKFNENGAIGLDFEGAAYRAKEYDLVSMIRGLASLTGESIEAMTDVVVQQYATVRDIDDQEATKAAVRALVEVTDY
ncbi:phosphotransferase [Psychromarinibacter sp. C21-152]|uniref:Phosphotransferase n=1 Tax=Psychromarinibacter sediminicola TaxID=3033385 RepID=A0AAE3NMU5_9RHOB|nr:phosphotransferase [Psychromarinibacter sediminicola]MDF0600828.1 phosphotransferase [Psychromarinibacter sediminicola]